MNTVIAFILMFGLLVFVHEFGHLIVAKRTGMLAREFAIGFGPKIFSFVKNETLYTIRLLPIGGYVRVAGEDPEIVELKPGHHVGLEFNDAGKVTKIIVNNKSKHPNARVIEIEKVDLNHALTIEGYELDNPEALLLFEVERDAFFIMDETETQIAPYDRQFASKTAGQRAAQLFAGPFMNFLLAIVIFVILGFLQGVPSEQAMVGKIYDDRPAAVAGFESGDIVTEVDGKKVSTWEDFTTVIREKPEEEIAVVVERNGTEHNLTVIPELVEDQQMKFGQIGVQLAFEKSLWRSLTNGISQTFETTKLIVVNLFMLVTGQLSIDMLAGPVGIYDVTDQVVQSGFYSFLMWTAMLSVNLGIINLVPLPALDGGRLLFVGIEAVRGKPIDPQKEGFVHFIGFALLMLLMIIVTWNDIQRLFL